MHTSIYLYMHTSIYLSIYLSKSVHIYLSLYLSIYLYLHTSIYLNLHTSIYLSIYLSKPAHIYLSIYLYRNLLIFLRTLGCILTLALLSASGYLTYLVVMASSNNTEPNQNFFELNQITGSQCSSSSVNTTAGSKSNENGSEAKGRLASTQLSSVWTPALFNSSTHGMTLTTSAVSATECKPFKCWETYVGQVRSFLND
ncbi:unnamed protein product [Acanthosepion pharaonis]|uniref:Uncharacterized protein n=1 Tax=Acanthosepion pharaonis TaxID=158019 RepID=A0A812EWU1_ACAPH|nr:unnamed protein product [Sepia pharaonis]